MRTLLIALALSLAGSAQAAYTGYLGLYAEDFGPYDPYSFGCGSDASGPFTCSDPRSGSSASFNSYDLGFSLNVSPVSPGGAWGWAAAEADVTWSEEWFLQGFSGPGTVEYTFNLGFPCDEYDCSSPPIINGENLWINDPGPFTLAVPFLDTSSLWWSVRAVNFSYDIFGGRGNSGSRSYSVSLGNVLILDEYGQAPAGISAFLGDGTHLPLDARNLVQNPEPGGLILLSIGLAVLMRTFRRR